jgi:NitT/TauT family transport system substrate-binding protein
MRYSRRSAIAVAAQTLAALAARPATSQTLATVRVGILTSTTDAPLWIADRLGYFKDEGIAVQFLTFTSGETMIAPLSTGALDVGGGSAAASFYNAVARGADIRIVADLGSDPPGYGFVQMLIRTDLVRTGRYKTFRDVKGMTLAANAPGSPGLPPIAKFLAKAGLALDDVKVIYLPYTQHGIALKNGSVDAAQTLEPFATDAVKNGYAVKIAGDDQYYPNQQISVVMFGGAFTRAHRDLGVRFLRGFIRGARFYNDALAGGKLAGPNADAVVKLLNDETKMDPAVLRDIVPTGCNPDGKLNVASLRDDLAFFKAHGYIEGEVTTEGSVDTSFAAEALRQLGRYKPAKR